MILKKVILTIGIISIISIISVFGGSFYYNYIHKWYFIETMAYNGDLDDWEYIALVNVTEEEMDDLPYLKKAIDDNISIEITRTERSNLYDFFYKKGGSSFSSQRFIYYNNIYYYVEVWELQ